MGRWLYTTPQTIREKTFTLLSWSFACRSSQKTWKGNHTTPSLKSFSFPAEVSLLCKMRDWPMRLAADGNKFSESSNTISYVTSSWKRNRVTRHGLEQKWNVAAVRQTVHLSQIQEVSFFFVATFPMYNFSTVFSPGSLRARLNF